MPETGVERPRFIAVIVCDQDTAPRADQLANQLGLPLWLLGPVDKKVITEECLPLLDAWTSLEGSSGGSRARGV